jgi:hypothetical protein
VVGSYVSDTDQVALEAQGLLQLSGYPKTSRAETAPSWTLGSAAVRVGRPGGLAALLQRSHAGTMINVRFRRSRRSTPSDHSDGLWAHLATLHPSQARGAAPRVGRLHLRRGRVFPVPPKRQPALRRVTRERVRCVRELDLSDRSQVPAGAGDAHRSERRSDAVSGLTGRMSFQLYTCL